MGIGDAPPLPEMVLETIGFMQILGQRDLSHPNPGAQGPHLITFLKKARDTFLCPVPGGKRAPDAAQDLVRDTINHEHDIIQTRLDQRLGHLGTHQTRIAGKTQPVTPGSCHTDGLCKPGVYQTLAVMVEIKHGQIQGMVLLGLGIHLIQKIFVQGQVHVSQWARHGLRTGTHDAGHGATVGQFNLQHPGGGGNRCSPQHPGLFPNKIAFVGPVPSQPVPPLAALFLRNRLGLAGIESEQLLLRYIPNLNETSEDLLLKGVAGNQNCWCLQQQGIILGNQHDALRPFLPAGQIRAADGSDVVLQVRVFMQKIPGMGAPASQNKPVK